MSADAGLFEVERVPYAPLASLAEIMRRDNGLTAVSTFSGCGGSSLGLHAAGWRIPYANEFIPAAREVYAANFPETFVDPRDIREVTAADILDSTGLDVGELDLFEGSPPCSSFANVNNRATVRFGSGKVKHYSEGVHQSTDELFSEWLRLVDGLRPRAVLAENVPGLLNEEATVYYRDILRRLNDAGYAVDVEVYNAMHYGAATSRRRLVLRGIRRDVGPLPPRPRRLTGGASLGDAMSSLPTPSPPQELAAASAEGYAIGPAWALLKLGDYDDKYRQVVRCDPARPLPSVTAAGQGAGTANPMHPHECRSFTPTELAWIFGYPADFTWSGTPAQRYERIARSVAPPLYAAHGAALADALTRSAAA